MGELNTLFRKRIGISESEILTFASLDCLLEKKQQQPSLLKIYVLSKIIQGK